MGKNDPGCRRPQPAGSNDRSSGTLGFVKTRYLLIISLATALIILGASAVWFLMAVA